MAGKGRKRAKNEGSIYQRGDGRWCAAAYVGYRTDGRPRRVVKYGKTQAEVLEKLREVQRQHARGELPASGSIKAGAWLDEWLEGVKAQHRLNSYRAYESAVRLHIKPQIGGRQLKTLETRHVAEMLSALDREGLSAKSRRHVLSILRRAIRAALRQHPPLLTRDPTVGVPLPSIEDEERDFELPARERIEALIRKARDSRYEAFFLLALCAGLRFAEIAALRWQDLDLGETPSVRVDRIAIALPGGGFRFQAPKTRASRRTVPLPALVVEALERHRARLGATPHPSRLVFTAKGKSPLHRGTFQRLYWQPLRESVGLPALRFHDLRHCFASSLVTTGAHPKVIQTLLGHESPAFSLRLYAHVEDRLKNEAAKALDALYAG